MIHLVHQTYIGEEDPWEKPTKILPYNLINKRFHYKILSSITLIYQDQLMTIRYSIILYKVYGDYDQYIYIYTYKYKFIKRIIIDKKYIKK